MISIKLKRIGRKKKPIYNIILTKNPSSTQKKYIDKLGFFNPLKTKNNIKINIQKIKYWLKNGAAISNRVKTLIKKYKIEN